MDRDTSEAWIARGLRNIGATWGYAARAMGGESAQDERVWLADSGSACPFFNCAALLGPLDEADVADFTARADAFFAARAGGSWLLWSGLPTPDLAPAGYTFWGEPPLMLLQPGGNPPPLPPELRIVEAHDAATVEAFEAVAVEGYPLSWVQPYRPGCLVDARVLGGPLRPFVGFVEERPVSCSLAFVDEFGVVGVNAVATVPEARGRGYGAALTWRASTVEPGLPAILQSSDLGRPIYERLGYTIVTRCSLWERARQPAAAPTSVE